MLIDERSRHMPRQLRHPGDNCSGRTIRIARSEIGIISLDLLDWRKNDRWNAHLTCNERTNSASRHRRFSEIMSIDIAAG